MAAQRSTFPISNRPSPGTQRSVVSPSAQTGMTMASVGAILAIATVWLEEMGRIEFGVGLTIGIALMPWVMTFIPSTASRLLPQPGAMCSILLGSGILVSLAGLFSERAIPSGIGAVIALTALTIWIAASQRRLLGRR